MRNVNLCHPTRVERMGQICIDSPTETGFSVRLAVNNSSYAVGFDGWHEEFDEEAEALQEVVNAMQTAAQRLNSEPTPTGD